MNDIDIILLIGLFSFQGLMAIGLWLIARGIYRDRRKEGKE